MLKLRVLQAELTICRLPADAPIPAWLSAPRDQAPLTSITRTPDELSIVCPSALIPADFTTASNTRTEPNWRAIGVLGPLAFSMVGVIASLTTPLAHAGISVFVVSTFDTDYVLVKGERLMHAVESLRQCGISVRLSPPS